MPASAFPVPSAAPPRSSITSYDSARWTNGAPRLDRVRRAFGIATLLQCGGSGVGEVKEADVPESDFATSLFPLTTPGTVDRRIVGKPARAQYRPGQGCLLAPGTDSWWTTEDRNNAGRFHIRFEPELLAEVQAVHNRRLETVPLINDRQIFWLVASFFDLVSQSDEPQPILWQSLGQILLWRLLMITAGPRGREDLRGRLAP